jgi:CheY-like chemotaxis protein/Flp pilus assembly protein TadD
MNAEHSLEKLCSTAHFLVIDDFESFRLSIVSMLTSYGAQSIDMAANAQQALNLARYKNYDVILCDFDLGSGKNGQQIIEELRLSERLKRTQLFIIITADTSKEVVLSTREFYPDAFIAKPITKQVFRERLHQLLQQQISLKPINKEIDVKNYSKAISLCAGHIAKKSKYRAWCLQTQASLYCELGDISNAQRIYSDVLGKRPIDWAMLGLGRVMYEEKKYQDSKNLYQDIIKRSPYMIEAYDGVSNSCLQMGQLYEAQQALEEAVSFSPRTVKRQSKLGELYLINQNIEAAARAYRHARHYGENSIHDTPELHLNLANCLCDMIEDTASNTNLYISEVEEILDYTSNHFKEDAIVDICASAIRARLQYHSGLHKDASLTLDAAIAKIDTDSIEPLPGLTIAKSLFSSKRGPEAERILLNLYKRFAHNSNWRQRIESQLEEPESYRVRIKAHSFNQQGIQLFEQGDFQGAIGAFQHALRLTPKHTSLNLNFVQVMLAAFQHNERTFKPNLKQDDLKTAQQSLKKLDYLPSSHPQYRRAQYLSKNLNKLITQQKET